MSSSGGWFPSFLPAVAVIPSRSVDAVFGRDRPLLVQSPLLPVLPLLLAAAGAVAAVASTTSAAVAASRLLLVLRGHHFTLPSTCRVQVLCCAVEEEIREGQSGQGEKEIVIQASSELLVMSAVIVVGGGCLNSAPVFTWTPL